jgi:hypothetical protein
VIVSFTAKDRAPPALGGAPTVVARTPTHVMGYWRNVFVAAVAKLDGQAVSRIGEGMLRLERASVSGVGLLMVVAPRSPTPTSDVRNQMAAAVRAVATLKGVATVYEEKGLHASIVRSVVAGIAFISPQNVPNRFFSALAEAAAWLDPLVHDAGSEAATHVRAVDLIRCDPQQLPAGVYVPFRDIDGK